MSDQNQISAGRKPDAQGVYNINADMPVPMLPPLHPETKQPVTPEYLNTFTLTALLARI